MKKQRKATTILELQAWKIEEAFNALQKEKSTKICTISKTDDEIVDAEIIEIGRASCRERVYVLV